MVDYLGIKIGESSSNKRCGNVLNRCIAPFEIFHKIVFGHGTSCQKGHAHPRRPDGDTQGVRLQDEVRHANQGRKPGLHEIGFLAESCTMQHHHVTFDSHDRECNIQISFGTMPRMSTCPSTCLALRNCSTSTTDSRLMIRKIHFPKITSPA